MSTEHPMDHLELFEEICSTTISNGIPEDYLKCKLFSFSLSDKGSKWLKSLQPASITIWEECISAFLNQFYTKSRSNLMRIDTRISKKACRIILWCLGTILRLWKRFSTSWFFDAQQKYRVSLDTSSNRVEETIEHHMTEVRTPHNPPLVPPSDASRPRVEETIDHHMTHVRTTTRPRS